jgi:hypothetical protein
MNLKDPIAAGNTAALLQKGEIFDWAPIIAGARLSENLSSERSGRLLKIVDQYCTAP